MELRTCLFTVNTQDQPKRDGVLEVGESAGERPERRRHWYRTKVKVKHTFLA